MSDPRNDSAELNMLLEKAGAHFARGSAIWNHFGLDSPQLAEEAARSALEEYRSAAELLAPDRFRTLTEEVQHRIAANRELALAHASSAESFLYDELIDEELEKIIELTQQQAEHMQLAIQHLELSRLDEPSTLLNWQQEVLHIRGREATLLGRLAGRRRDLSAARTFYERAQDNFRKLMDMYEAETPALASITDAIQTVTAPSDRLEEGDSEGKIHFTALILVASRTSPPLPNEDLYRRAAANFYSNAALVAHVRAFQILKEGGPTEDAEAKFEKSIEHISSAMEVFPENLGFHEDLFNAWRARGEIFGCPIEETENYYHIRCPLAIMYHVGHWYVSPAIEYNSLECSVCGLDILECPHYPGESVDGKVVSYHPQNPRLISGSMVSVPEDPRCRIQWTSIPKHALPSPPEDGSELRCHLCTVDGDKDRITSRLIDLPEWAEQEANERYRQTMHSKRFRSIRVNTVENNDV